MDNDNETFSNRLKRHSKIVLKAFLVALWITACVMFAIMILGVIEIGHGIILHFDPKTNDNNESTSIIKILQGLELIFLSPLFYLLILSLTKYISATKPEINSNALDLKRNYMNHAILEIMNVKVLNVSLFISILILHALSLILSNAMTTLSIIYILSLLVVLIAFYFMLDLMVEKLRK